MPRYSYVVAFPVLIALCVGINIQRYPAVSAMLRGESVESRWLGRSEVFDFQAKQTGESKSYQGYRSDSEHVADSRASRVPIPLSESLSTPALSTSSPQSTASTQSTQSSWSTPASQSGTTNTSSRSSANSTLRDNERNNGPYDSDFSGSRSGNMEYTGTTGVGSTSRGNSTNGMTNSNSSSISSTGSGLYNRDSYSWQSDSYESRPYSGESNGLTDTFSSSPDPYNNSFRSDSYKNSYSTSSFPLRNEDRNNYDQPEDRTDTKNNTGDRSECRTSSDNRYSQPDDYHPGSFEENSFRMDSPLPGYSSRYPAAAGETTSIAVTPVTPATPTAAATSNGIAIVTATAMETEPATPQTRMPLSLQEKHELRLATPFSFSSPGSQNTSSDQYIPPDFLSSHEYGIVGKLVNPSTEPAVSITPITFVSRTTPNTASNPLPETATTPPETDEGAEIIP